MAKVFVDTNYFIGLAGRTPETDSKTLDRHDAFISTLSCHIYCYVNKVKIPNKKFDSYVSEFNLINFSNNILKKAQQGPTIDLEDNVQLHSAVEAECEYFLTNDKKLLKMKFFGKAKIAKSINHGFN